MKKNLQKNVFTIRSFSRSYTDKLGILNEKPYDPSLNLTESRIVYELAQHQQLRSKDLLGLLSLDKGYLSRALASLKKRKILTEHQGTEDTREKWLSLTEKGSQLFEKIDGISIERTEEVLQHLSPFQRSELNQHLAAAQLILDPKQKIDISEVQIRDLKPGDLGWVISRHGEIYAAEYGWTIDFEFLVADIASRFAQKNDPKFERAWIAEARGLRLGCVFLVKEDAKTAKLRILLVDPMARGLGLGSRLVQECIRFAKSCGYKQVTLWTNDILTSARKIYEAEGFVLEKEEKHTSFGKKLNGQYWSKTL
ncbi:MAG: MarR family transcriptional regulator [Bdellovibrionales bacterium]|nr:MarR family transcriptional regulator [Bdellovibrionales bacterium]